MATEDFFLANLPTEVLALILSFRASDAAIRLWKCGNQLLNHRLAEGGVLTVKLKDTRMKTSSKWPRCLSAFSRLQKLVVWRPEKALKLEDIRNGLQSLSSTLEHLEIHCLNSWEALFRPEALEETEQDGQAHHHVLGARQFNRVFDDNTVAMWDLNAKFPNLQTLILGGQPQCRLRFTSKLDFGALPRSLTRLELKTGLDYMLIVVTPPWDRFDLLPSGLKTLHMMFHENVEVCWQSLLWGRQHFAQLPPGLTDLAGITYDQTTLSSADVALLVPPSMTKMKPRFGRTREPILLPNARYAELMTIDFVNNPVPMTVTDLDITYSGKFTAEQVLALPRKLTRLKMFDCDLDWAHLTPSHLPDRLLTFEMRCKLPVSALSLIPRTVTSLAADVRTLTIDDPIDLAAMLHLPPKIRSLLLTVGQVGPLVKDSAVLGLPRDLRTLAIPAWDASSSPKLFFETLPPYLTTLTLNGPEIEGYWNAEHFINLPKTLTDLSLHNAPINVDYWQFLPHSLKRLLHAHQGLGPMFVNAIGKIRLLPPNLKHFGFGRFVMSGADLKHLPRTLKRLYLNGDSALDLGCVIGTRLKHLTQLPTELLKFEVAFVDFCAKYNDDLDLARTLLPHSLDNITTPIFPPEPQDVSQYFEGAEAEQVAALSKQSDTLPKRCELM